ncbi:MAG TPA: cyclic nucleotide-binding and patatin-like phospholipase domain-containing protein [Trueperaceae bacterium]
MPASPDDVLRLLGDVSLFRTLSAEELDAVAQRLEPVELPAHATVFRQGELGDAMYVLAEGRLAVSVDGATVDSLAPGSVVGELALLTAPERNATVTAAADGAKLWRLSREDFERLTAQRPHVLEAVHAVGRPRLQRAQLAPLLSQRFGVNTETEIAALQAAALWRDVGRGDVLYRVGDAVDYVYLVVSGRFEVREERGDLGRRVGRGGVLGEAAVTGQAVRTHEAVATRDSHVVALPADLAAGSPRFVASVAADLLQRLNRAAPPTPAGAGGVALLPVTDKAPITQLAGALAQRFAEWGPTVTLSSRLVDERFGRAGVAQVDEFGEMAGPLTLWLDQQVRSHESVVLVCDTADTPWRRRCLRLADTVLLVASADGGPEVGATDGSTSVDTHGEPQLVLVHPDDTQLPRGTARWLETYDVSAHHHVRLGDSKDLDRLARRLAGRATGVALSGGGARGYVHIGLFRALEENDVPVDVVYGTSMGALIGGIYALTREASAGYRLAERFGDRRQLMDRTIPLVALTRSRKVTQTMRSLYGDDTRIEDLWIPFCCVSASLTNAELRVHDRGLMWRAIRASTAIPGIFTPILDEGGEEVLVDGGVMNNLPVDLLRAFMGAGTVIASNAYGGKSDGKPMSFGDDVSGWAALRSKLLPFGRRIRAPSLLGTLMRATSLASKSLLDEAAHYADLVVTYPSSEVTSLEFDSYAETIEVGYRHASEALQAWLHPPHPADP